MGVAAQAAVLVAQLVRLAGETLRQARQIEAAAAAVLALASPSPARTAVLAFSSCAILARSVVLVGLSRHLVAIPTIRSRHPALILVRT